MKKSFATDTLESMSQAVWYNKWTVDKFRSFLSGDILEVGCGIGNFTKFLTYFGKVFAIDINKEFLKETARLSGGKAKVGFGDIEKAQYFFSRQKFNCIVCLNVLEHIENDDQAVRNLYKLLEDKGYLIIIVPIHPFLYGSIDKTIGHFRRYSKKEIVEKIKRNGLKILISKKLNFFGVIGWYIDGKILGRNRVEKEKIKIFNLISPFVLPLEDLIEPPFGTSLLIVAQK